MRVFIAGATGVIGRRVVPLLVANGHEVTGMTRSPAKADGLRAAGAEPVVADALDAGAVMEAVRKARPEVVVHELTDLSSMDASMRRPDRAFAGTNRLRTEGTDHLVAAARAAGARRLVAQSFGAWQYAREGAAVRTEEDPLDPDPPGPFRSVLEAILHLESAVLGAADLEGVVLRYGGLYGPGTSIDVGGEHSELVRHRRFPLVGDAAGVWSFVHADDAATATVAAIERGASGIYNVVDDEPAAVAEWLPALAAAMGASPPRHLPAWAARLLAGEFAVVMMTQVRGSSNAKAKAELGWAPQVPTWRQGFRELFAPRSVPRAG